MEKGIPCRKLEELGFKKYRCKVCGSVFWSKVPRETCGDAPCERYRFLDIGCRRLGYEESMKEFLQFFERNGHKVIDPRPVVARWREDLYLTIASIVLFQPHVTSGMVPPPANPLVVAQPCIRLEDIDNVGLTMGRHLTNFIMGGHHAFNYPDKWVYWIDETVDYAYRFFVEDLRVPEEEITFKESWWEGGGNAGPAFEVAIGGLEVATLVFMQYSVENGKYLEMPIKVVDTGYGIERIAWLASKGVTAFHVIYGDLVHHFFVKLGVDEPSEDILRAALVESYGVDSVEDLAEKVSRDLGVSSKEVASMLRRAVEVFSLLDLTKTIALMLSDGVVPSNSGEGYLARLVIRRALRKISALGSDVKLGELVDLQIEKWYHLFPRMGKMRSYILEVLDIEEEKFREIIKSLPQIAKKFLKKQPSLEDLVELYDSRGVPPDMLAEYLRKVHGIAIDVPKNFYSMVAARHARTPLAKKSEKARLPNEIVEWTKNFPPTRRLFHEDPYLREFRSKVLGVLGNYVVLDATAFYPEGGGQLGDTGEICYGSECVKVVDTQKVGDVVVHVVERPISIAPGAEIVGKVDWERRYRLMRHHTATHLLLGALRKVLGEHVWQAGAEKTPTKARLDVTHYKIPSVDELKSIEKLVNEMITKGIHVVTKELDRNEAEERYGFVIYQGGVPQTARIRIVEIPGWDVEACFGTHVKNTSELGGFHIVNVEKIADGVVRFEYVAGTALIDYVSELEQKLSDIATAVGSSKREVADKVRSMVGELRNANSLLKAYRDLIVREVTSKASYEARDYVSGTKIFVYKLPVKDYRLANMISRELTQKIPRLIAFVLAPHEKGCYVEISLGKEAASLVDARSIIKELAKRLPIKGGGKHDHVTAIAEVPMTEFVNVLEKALSTDLIKAS